MEYTQIGDYEETCADPNLEQQEDKGKLGKPCVTGGSIIPIDLHSSIPKLLVLIIYKYQRNCYLQSLFSS